MSRHEAARLPGVHGPVDRADRQHRAAPGGRPRPGATAAMIGVIIHADAAHGYAFAMLVDGREIFLHAGECPNRVVPGLGQLVEIAVLRASPRGWRGAHVRPLVDPRCGKCDATLTTLRCACGWTAS